MVAVARQRSTREVVRQRIDAVLKLRLNGAGPLELREYAERQGWRVTTRQIRRYVAEADRCLKRFAAKNRSRIVARLSDDKLQSEIRSLTERLEADGRPDLDVSP